MCTLKERDPDLNLFAWYAPALHGPWTEHANNPVKTDIRSARPAGRPFEHEGFLYRPAQDCSRSYGSRVVINRILELTPTGFREEAAAVVDPYKHSRYPHGLHTLSAVGDLTVVDGKRELRAVEWDAFYIYRAAQKVGRVLLPRKRSGSGHGTEA